MFMYMYSLQCSECPVSVLLQQHISSNMSQMEEDIQRIVVRRRHVWEDTVRKIKGWLSVTKQLKVTFVGDIAVDEGGPRREFLYLLMESIASNNSQTPSANKTCQLRLGSSGYYHSPSP